MKKTFLAVLATMLLVSAVLLGMFFLTSCAGIPPSARREGQPAPRVFIESITFYSNLEVGVNSKKGKPEAIFSEVRNDELAQKASEAFRPAFLERLKKNEIEIVEAASVPYRIKVSLAYTTKLRRQAGGSSEWIIKPTGWGEFRMDNGKILVFMRDQEVFEKGLTKITFLLKGAGINMWARERNNKSLANDLADELARYFSGKITLFPD